MAWRCSRRSRTRRMASALLVLLVSQRSTQQDRSSLLSSACLPSLAPPAPGGNKEQPSHSTQASASLCLSSIRSSQAILNASGSRSFQFTAVLASVEARGVLKVHFRYFETVLSLLPAVSRLSFKSHTGSQRPWPPQPVPQALGGCRASGHKAGEPSAQPPGFRSSSDSSDPTLSDVISEVLLG